MTTRGTPDHCGEVTPVEGRSERLADGSNVSFTEVVGALDVVVEEADAFDDVKVVVVTSGTVVVVVAAVVVVAVSLSL